LDIKKARLRIKMVPRRALVEPQRIELWSREDKRVDSTCLVNFDCREQQGSQQPQLLLSHYVLAVFSNLTQSSSDKRHRIFTSRRTKAVSDVDLSDLIGDKLI